MIELNITIKDSDGRKLSRDFLVYESFTIDENDPIIQSYLNEVLEEFQGEPEDVRVRAQAIFA